MVLKKTAITSFGFKVDVEVVGIKVGYFLFKQNVLTQLKISKTKTKDNMIESRL